MTLLDDGAAPGSCDGAPAAVDIALSGLSLDAHHGLPASLATGTAKRAQRAPPRLACLPSDTQLLKALRDNGFHPGSAPPAGHVAASGGAGDAGQQQQHPAGPAGGGQRGWEQGPVLRLQAVKLVLHTAAAVCRYCRRVSRLLPGTSAHLCSGAACTARVHNAHPAACLDAAAAAIQGCAPCKPCPWPRPAPH